MRGAPLKDRFWAKVAKGAPDECWLWTGAKGGAPLKYGHIRYNGTITAAHRVSFELHHGAPPGACDVMHRCDVPLCVNPAHLTLGTRAENNKDRMRKLRSARKLDPQAVHEIRRLRNEGVFWKPIAARFGVSVRAIRKVYFGETWSHV